MSNTSILPRMLLVRAPGRVCAVPLTQVSEVCRPLPVEPVAGAPTFVQGLCILRGAPVPVLDLGALLGGGSSAVAEGRFVALQIGNRRVAVAVEAVLGIRVLDAGMQEMPPLLQEALPGIVEAVGRLDGELLLLLRAALLLAEDAWRAIQAADPAP